MNRAIIEKLISAAKSKAEAYELFISDFNSVSVSYDKGRLEDIQQRGSSGASIRAARGGKLGFAVTNRPEDAAELVDSALRLAPYGVPLDFSFAPKAESKFSCSFDPRLGDVMPDYLAGLGNHARDLMKELVPEALFSGGYSVGSGSSRVVTSAGQDAEERGASMGVSIAAEYNQEGNFLTIYDYKQSRKLLDKTDVEKLVRDVADEFSIARNPAPFQAGTCRVLFHPDAVGDLLMPAAVAINGVNIEEKTSRWVEARGSQVLDKRITIWDDPAHEEAPSQSGYDGEGTPTQRRALIDQGVLTGFVHSRSTAAHTGEQPTGNGQRALASVGKPGLHSIIMEPGTESVDGLLKQAEGGLYIKRMLGTFTSNFLAGAVSGNISLGYLVKDGEPVGRVKNCALNINAFDLLSKAILGISKDRRWRGGQCLPWILLDGVAISAK